MYMYIVAAAPATQTANSIELQILRTFSVVNKMIKFNYYPFIRSFFLCYCIYTHSQTQCMYCIFFPISAAAHKKNNGEM